MGGDVPAIPLPGFLLRFLLRQLMQSEEDGTMGLLKCLCDPHAVSGQFYGPVGKGLVGGKHDTAAYSGPAMLMPTETLAVCHRGSNARARAGHAPQQQQRPAQLRAARPIRFRAGRERAHAAVVGERGGCRRVV
jgi:hypothetical protein